MCHALARIACQRGKRPRMFILNRPGGVFVLENRIVRARLHCTVTACGAAGSRSGVPGLLCTRAPREKQRRQGECGQFKSHPRNAELPRSMRDFQAMTHFHGATGIRPNTARPGRRNMMQQPLYSSRRPSKTLSSVLIGISSGIIERLQRNPPLPCEWSKSAPGLQMLIETSSTLSESGCAELV